MTDDTPARDQVERDELYLGDSWAALLIAERTKTVQAERERDEARKKLEAAEELARLLSYAWEMNYDLGHQWDCEAEAALSAYHNAGGCHE